MLLIGLMLAGCGAQDKQLRLQHINDQKTITSLKEEMAQMRAERTQGWWNWKLDEKGWGSWITTKTIAATTAVVAVAASLGYQFYKTNQIGDKAEDANTRSISAYNEIIDHESQTDKAHKPPVKPSSPSSKGKGKPPAGSPLDKPESKVPGGSDKPSDTK